MSEILLLVTALLPAIALCIYIYKKDRVEKEPFSLLALLLLSGIVICFPVLLLSSVFDAIIQPLFSPYGYFDLNNLSDGQYILYNFIYYFFGVALREEGFKWLALFLITKNNKHFSSLFDGIVYATFISLGFAGFENILYAFNYGWTVAVIRMATAVPAHTFFGVFMGFYYGWYHIKTLANKNENMLKSMGVLSADVQKTPATKELVFSLIIPVLAHGFYDFCCMDIPIVTAIFYFFLIFMYVFCFLRIKKVSSEDMQDKELVLVLLSQKHPGVKQAIDLLYDYKARHDFTADKSNSRITFTELVQILAIIKGDVPSVINHDYSETLFISPKSEAEKKKKMKERQMAAQFNGYYNQQSSSYPPQGNPYAQPSSNYPPQGNPYAQQSGNYPPRGNPYQPDANPYANYDNNNCNYK